MLLIFLPFLIVTLILTVQSYNYAMEERQNNNENTLDVIKSSIVAEARRIEDLASSMAINSSLLDMLQANNKLNAEYYDKYREANRFVSESSISFGSRHTLKINLFLRDGDINIYEGFGRFYKISRIENQEWYRRFAESGRSDMWVRVNRDTYYNRYDYHVNNNVYEFALIRKVFSYTGNELGIIVIEVPDELIISKYGIDSVFVQCSETSKLLYRPSDSLLQLVGGDEAIAALPQGKTVNGSFESIINEFPEMQLRIGVINNSEGIMHLLSENVGLYIFLMAFLLILILAFAVLLRYIIRSLSRCIRSIEIAIRGNEPSLLPDDRRGDIGQLVAMFNLLSARVRNMISERVALETSAQNAQIHEMQTRLSPHFFYNTLDVISSTILLAGQVEIAEAVADFGKMMRYSFRDERETTLGAEIRCVRSYVNLQKMRYKDRITLTIDVEPELNNVVCMKFILQPVVENSIRHGMRHDGETLHISIHTDVQEDNVVNIIVQDDGVGMNADKLKELRDRLSDICEDERDEMSFGVGLYNVNNQLMLRYGKNFHIRIDSFPCNGTTIILPISTKDGVRHAEDTVGR